MKIGSFAKLCFALSLGVSAIGQTLPKSDIVTTCGFSVLGYNMYFWCYLTDPTPALPVHLEVNDADKSKLLLTTNPHVKGQSSVDFVVNDRGFFYPQNVATSSGSAVITISTPGKADTFLTIPFVPSGFAFSEKSATGVEHGPEVVGGINVYALDTNRNVIQEQALRPGLTEKLYLANLRPDVGQPNNPVTYFSTPGETQFFVRPKAAGTDVLCIVQPNGYEESRSNNEVTITVTPE